MIVGKVYLRNTKHFRKIKYTNLNIDMNGEQFLGDNGSVIPSRLIKPPVYMTVFFFLGKHIIFNNIC